MQKYQFQFWIHLSVTLACNATASKVWQFSPLDFPIRFGQLLVVTPRSSGPSKYELNLKIQTIFVKIIKCDHCEFLVNTAYSNIHKTLHL